MLAFFGIIGAFLGIGAALDRVVTDEGKRAFFGLASRSYVGPARAPASFVARVADLFLGLVQGPFAAPRTVLFVLSWSLLVFIATLAIQHFVQGQDILGNLFGGIPSMAGKIAFVGCIVLTLLATDYISFVETRVLLSLLSHTRGVVEVTVLLAAELLCTMAVFAGVFSLGIVASVYLSDLSGGNTGTLRAALDPNGKMPEPRDLDEISETLRWRAFGAPHRYQLILYSGEVSDYIQSSTPVYATAEVTGRDIASILPLLSFSHVSVSEAEARSGFSPYLKEYEGMGGYSYVAVARYAFHRRSDIGALDSYYTAAFSASDSAQDGFPSSVLLLDPGWLRLSSLDTQVTQALAAEEAPSVSGIACRRTDTYALIAREQLSECGEWVILNGAIVSDLWASREFWDRRDAGSVPIYSAFMSSLTMTVFFYILFVSALFVRGTEDSFIARGVGPAWLKTADHPFTLALGLIGTGIAGIYTLFTIFGRTG